ncbi:MAG: hypothetical protein WD250_08995 [Egibacteraceae bacterium]
MGVGEVDDHLGGGVGVVEGMHELVGGSEEQLVGDLDEVGDTAGEEDRGQQDARSDAVGEVVGDDHGGDGDHHDRGLGARGGPQGLEPQAVPVEGGGRDHDHHRDQRRHGDEGHEIASGQDQHEQEHPSGERRHAGAGTGLHVDHGLAEHGAPGHAADKAGGDVGEPLAAGLTALVRAGVGDVVEDLGGQQRLEQADECQRERHGRDNREGLQGEGHGGEPEPGQGRGQLTHAAHGGRQGVDEPDHDRATIGSTPAMIEKAMASGISATATSRPASSSGAPYRTSRTVPACQALQWMTR